MLGQSLTLVPFIFRGLGSAFSLKGPEFLPNLFVGIIELQGKIGILTMNFSVLSIRRIPRRQRWEIGE